ncbi:MAG: VanZ family protein [Nitrospiraceae bacterium]|nr:MAG: VanZ family protein [Nitrospiraceae bacterium]
MKGDSRRELRQWIWVLLCALAIFSTVPAARGVQKFVYASAGKDFFTYLVLSVIIAGLAVILYFFIFRLKVKNISQYLWALAGSGLYVYFTTRLRKHPEEAVHLLEYGLLSFFLFKALTCRIRDWTVYITTLLIVSFVGTMEEFVQWVTPGRVWDFKDVGTNILGGSIAQLIIWKGIRPDSIGGPLKKASVKIFSVILTVDLILTGLCLSNTPDAVTRYTAIFKSLSWLRAEEPMSEFGHIKTAWILIAVSLIVIWSSVVRWIKRH